MITFPQWLDDRDWRKGPTTSLDDEHQEYKAAIGPVPPGLENAEFSKEITRKQAWETIAYFWLPDEWHRDAGIAELIYFPHISGNSGQSQRVRLELGLRLRD
jgi:hypothetical protein